MKMGKLRKVGTRCGDSSRFSKERVLDAAGGYITPGFLDSSQTRRLAGLWKRGMMSF